MAGMHQSLLLSTETDEYAESQAAGNALQGAHLCVLIIITAPLDLDPESRGDVPDALHQDKPCLAANLL